MENMETSVSITLYQLYLTAGSRPVGWGGEGGLVRSVELPLPRSSKLISLANKIIYSISIHSYSLLPVLYVYIISRSCARYISNRDPLTAYRDPSRDFRSTWDPHDLVLVIFVGSRVNAGCNRLYRSAVVTAISCA